VEKDAKRAEVMFRLAADQGIGEAQYSVGYILYVQKGPEDDREAAKSLGEAAKQGGRWRSNIWRSCI
jgi:TPR repeat protein